MIATTCEPTFQVQTVDGWLEVHDHYGGCIMLHPDMLEELIETLHAQQMNSSEELAALEAYAAWSHEFNAGAAALVDQGGRRLRLVDGCLVEEVTHGTPV